MSETDWCAVGKAERQLITDAIAFAKEMNRVNATTYDDKNPYFVDAASSFFEAVMRYDVAVKKAAPFLMERP